MWLKSLSSDAWVNMNHITHFSIVETQIVETGEPLYNEPYSVHTYLSDDPEEYGIRVCEGNMEECKEFIKEQLLLQSTYQWIGYLVAGGVGAVITLLFT